MDAHFPQKLVLWQWKTETTSSAPIPLPPVVFRVQRFNWIDLTQRSEVQLFEVKPGFCRKSSRWTKANTSISSNTEDIKLHFHFYWLEEQEKSLFSTWFELHDSNKNEKVNAAFAKIGDLTDE